MKELQQSSKEFAEYAFSKQASAECVGGEGHLFIYRVFVLDLFYLSLGSFN